MKKICFFTSTRADYGLLRLLMSEIKKSKKLDLQIVATAMHLEKEFGLTIKQIENDRFQINKKIHNLFLNDSSVGIIKSAAVGMMGYADALEELKPDAIFILGDRFEIFASVFSALISNIPIFHYSGGEVTEGAYDDALRHSITKMSNYHFVSAEEYKKRVIQLGEDPEKVYMVGNLGHEAILRTKIFNKKELENKLAIKFLKNSLLITYHPETSGNNNIEKDFEQILDSLNILSETSLIFTLPNFDTNSSIIEKKIINFCSQKENAYFFRSLGQKMYFSTIKIVDGVIGNSSSGLTEVPLFNKGTVNIGSRQKGRIKDRSVIDCQAVSEEINKAIKKLYSEKFANKKNINPLNLHPSKEIVKILEHIELNKHENKKFFDI